MFFFVLSGLYTYLCKIEQFKQGGHANEKDTIYFNVEHRYPANAGS